MNIATAAQMTLSFLYLTLALAPNRYKIFRIYCAVACAATATYRVTDAAWLARFYPFVICVMLAGRILITAEVLARMAGVRLKGFVFGCSGVAIGSVIISWRYRGLKLAPWVEISNYIQIGTALLLLLPLLIFWRFGRSTAHAWVMLAYLGIYAGIGAVSTALHKFGASWWDVNLAAYGACIACCIAWIKLRLRAGPQLQTDEI